MGFDLDRDDERRNGHPVIKVIGVGGAGNNAVNRMIEMGIHGVEFIAVNTDLQVLEANKAPVKIQIGKKVTRGLGAGGDPNKGKEAAVESKDEIREVLEGSDMLFITAGFGGGTGTGASPVIAEVARSLGILTVAIVTTPFFFEGKTRWLNAVKGLKEMKGKVDTLIRISNNKILEEKDVEVAKAFFEVDSVLHQGVKGISDLITKRGIINLDFADIESVMRDSGAALLGMGVGKGENRAIEAAEKAMHNKMVDYPVEDARAMIINVTGPHNIRMQEVYDAMIFIRQNTGEDTDVIFGLMQDDEMQEDQIMITLIATKFEEDERILIPDEDIPAIFWTHMDFKRGG